MNRIFLFALTGSAALCLSTAASAHGAHEHGVAHMNVSIEKQEFEIEIESPLANFLPFEHAPETAEQKLAVQAMLGKLRQPSALFLPNPQASCLETKREFESEALEQNHKHHGHEKHADIDIDQEFHCARPDKLTALSTDLFKLFPALREVRVQFISDKGQKSFLLTPENSRLEW